MIDESNRDDAFIERVSDKLRVPVRADASFAARVLSAVQRAAAESAAHGKPWWRRHFTLTFTPVGALAMAAGVVLAVVAAGALGPRVIPERFQAASPVKHDTVHIVRFVFTDSSAREVVLVGTFNDWTKGATRLAEVGGRGVWSAAIALAPGRYEYAFVVRDTSGERWVADPFALLVRDDFGTESSIVSVGGTS